jgi:hypothetical protein
MGIGGTYGGTPMGVVVEIGGGRSTAPATPGTSWPELQSLTRGARSWNRARAWPSSRVVDLPGKQEV